MGQNKSTDSGGLLRSDWCLWSSSVPEAGSGAEARLSDICRPYHQVFDHLHSPEHRVKLLCELLVIGVQVGALLHVVEGQLALLIVQVHPNFPGHHALWQRGGGHRQGFQICAPLQTEGQVACICVEWAEALPRRGCLGHTEPPVPLAHLHLPVVASAGVALPAHGTPPAVEALLAPRDFLTLQAAPHSLFIAGDEQVRVGWVWVQSHVLCGVVEQEGKITN